MEEFAKTRRGQKYFDVDLPKVAMQLERIANAIESQNKLEEQRQLFEKQKMQWEKKVWLSENNKPNFIEE
jgi:hypothetical protein